MERQNLMGDPQGEMLLQVLFAYSKYSWISYTLRRGMKIFHNHPFEGENCLAFPTKKLLYFVQIRPDLAYLLSHDWSPTWIKWFLYLAGKPVFTRMWAVT